MARLLVDSDILIDHLRGHRRFMAGEHEVHVSVVTRAELLAGRVPEERTVRRLLDAFTEIPVDGAIAARAGRLRRSAGIRLPDAIIAATALEHRLGLATRKVRDFADIKALRIHLPADAR